VKKMILLAVTLATALMTTLPTLVQFAPVEPNTRVSGALCATLTLTSADIIFDVSPARVGGAAPAFRPFTIPECHS
jgi:hypothetical protein